MASAESVDEKGYPTQILKFEFDEKRHSTLVLDKGSLDQILKKAGDRQVVLISIVGPSRQGKSFLLGFLLRYLESLNTEDTDWFGYDSPEKKLDGFKWRLGVEPETTGMWMWSNPFVVKLGDGKECCVLLMDTQGTYDEYTSQREWSSIVGLSLLTSSTLIFNFMQNLQEDTLLSLGAFMEFGLMASSEDSNSSPFQKLVFLIRDWNTPSEYPYGAKGGSCFLTKKLDIKPDHGEDAKRIRESIKKCFEELSCVLLPDPGEKMKQPDYNGSIQGLSPKFAKFLESFVTDLLHNDYLKVKRIGGNPVKASELGFFFEKYVEIFNSEDVLQPMNLFHATALVIITNVVSNSIEEYRKAMNLELRRQVFLSDQGIAKCHSTSSAKCIKYFDSAKKSGDQALIEEHKGNLLEEIERGFDAFKVQNSAKKAKLIQGYRQDAINQFVSGVKNEMGDMFLDSKELRNLSESGKSDAISMFAEQCSSEDPDQLLLQINSLQEALIHEECGLLAENDKRILEAEKKNTEIVQYAVEVYSNAMKNGTDESIPLPTDQFESSHLSSMGVAQDYYDANATKECGRSFLQKFKDKFVKQIETYSEALRKENEQKMELLNLKVQEYVATTVKKYESQMSIIVEDVTSEDALQDEHDTCIRDIFASFELTSEFPEEIVKAQFTKLNTMVSESFTRFKHQFVQNSRNLDAECEKAVADSMIFYNESMSIFLNSKEFHRNEEFEGHHDTIRQEAVDRAFEDLERIGVQEEKQEEYLNKLKSELDLLSTKLTEQNTMKQSHAAAKAQNDVSDFQRKYQEEMKSEMDTCRTQADLNAVHDRTKDSVVQDMTSKYQDVHPTFIDPYIFELETEIDKTFEDLSELFELKREESEAGTKSALADAQKFYREEFEKHFSSRDFMSPQSLDALHKAVTKITVDRCNEKTTLSPIQKEDLSSFMKKVYQSYKDLNYMNMPADPAIGFDLGTTFCCVGVYAKGKVTIIENKLGYKTTPSYVYFSENGEAVVGEAAKNQAHEDPENTIFDAKRIIGRKMDDEKLQRDMKVWPFKVIEENGVPKIVARGKTYHPEQISAKLLAEMKKAAEDYLCCSVTNVVITVPAYFNDGQRQATIDAGEIAGLKVLRIIDEPTSAAIAYRLQHADLDARNILIFDLGGGTFDVAVLRIKDGEIEVKSKDGDTHLGGEDFDNNMLEYCVLEFQRQQGIDLTFGKNSANASERSLALRVLKRLKHECELRKVDLSSSKKVNIALDAVHGGLDLNVSLTRDKFNEMNASLFAKTIEIVERVLKSAKIAKSDINDIVLVGGSTRIPRVQELLSDFFSGKALNKNINPDEAVAYGAAIQAAILNGEIAKDSVDFTRIQDVTPMSLGVEVIGGFFSIIIRKNSHIPAKFKHDYYTAHHNQTSMRIQVYQGEDKAIARNNQKLGEFDLNGIPPAERGVERVEIEMEINEQGILHVTAHCVSTGKEKDLVITEYKQRLSRSQIQNMLLEGANGA